MAGKRGRAGTRTGWLAKGALGVLVGMSLAGAGVAGPAPPAPALSMDFDPTAGDQGERAIFQAAPGQQHEFQLYLRDAPEIEGWSTVLHFDPAQLRYLSGSFRPSGFIAGLVPLVDEREGSVSVGGSVLGDGATSSGSGVVGRVAFEVLAGFGGSANLRLDEFLLKPPEGEVVAHPLSHSVNILGPDYALISLDLDPDPGDQRQWLRSDATAGATFTVQLYLSEAPEITGWSARIDYDPNQVRYVQESYSQGPFLGDPTPELETELGVLIVGATGSSSTGSGSGVLGTVDFEIRDSFAGTALLTVAEISLRRTDGPIQTTSTRYEAVLLGAPGPGSPTAVHRTTLDLAVPPRAHLLPNFPNPFNAGTTIAYQLADPGEVTVDVFDLAGQKVKTLVSAHLRAGSYAVRWDGTDQQGRQVSSGAYLLRLQTDRTIHSRDLLLTK